MRFVKMIRAGIHGNDPEPLYVNPSAVSRVLPRMRRADFPPLSMVVFRDGRSFYVQHGAADVVHALMCEDVTEIEP